MPMRYEIDPNARLVRSTAWGILTGEDVRLHQESLGADPAFDPTYQQLGDFRGVSDARVDTESIREVARTRLFVPEVRRALVADSDLVYGLARMYQQLGGFDERNGQVFRTLAEALAFLGMTAVEAGVRADAPPHH
jgi:hypothetical protein